VNNGDGFDPSFFIPAEPIMHQRRVHSVPPITWDKVDGKAQGARHVAP
jgi:hypothetical protein